MTEVQDDADAALALRAWAASGAMALTGRSDGPPLGPPAPLVGGLASVADRIRHLTGRLGRPVDIDPLALLAERGAIAGTSRRGRVSCGGATRLLPAADGWLAVSLAREDDVDLLPAWLGVAPTREVDAAWELVAGEVPGRPLDELVAGAAVLGLPVGVLPRRRPPVPGTPDAVVRSVEPARLGDRPPTTSLEDIVVVDLGALWAGPLCGSLLADAGATVVKVESTARPDGARRGPAAFFDLLNAGKRSVAVDLADPGGRATLRALVQRADVVVEASRPRALEQLGIDARSLLRTDGPSVWVSITAHGRSGPGRDRVGFGDDAAVEGGLVVWEDGEPLFCADAVADPCAGLAATAAALDALTAGGTWLLDVPLAGVAAGLAGPTLPVPQGLLAEPPAATRHRGSARPLGADTGDVLARLGIA